MNILVAGVGNVLRGDDAFGVEVARYLIESGSLGAGIEVFEAGIAGIAFVQELMNDYDALIIADAVDRGGAPGTLYLIEPDIPDPGLIEPAELHRSLVDAHYTEPSKALLLARALNVLPPRVFIVGCQTGPAEPGAEMSRPVRDAVRAAVKRIETLIEELTSTARS